MNKQYRLLVFDWEGTLGDTLGQVLHCMAAEAKRLNFGELDEDIARQSIELGLANTIKKAFPNLIYTQHEQLLNAVQQSLMFHHNEAYLIPGAKEVISRIYNAGINMAIATNKGHHGLQRALHHTGLDKFFKVTRCAGQLPPKPCAKMLEEILLEFVVSVHETLMIGDSVTDIQMATSIDMDAVGMNFYHQEPNTLLAAGALKVFDDYQQFADYLQLSA